MDIFELKLMDSDIWMREPAHCQTTVLQLLVQV